MIKRQVSTNIDSHQYHVIVSSEPLSKRSSVGKPVCNSFPVLQVACYGVRTNRNKQERKSYLLWGGDRLQKIMRLRQVGATAEQSQISPVSCSLSYIHLLQSLSFSAWVSVTLCSDQDRLQHLSCLWLCSCCLLMIPSLLLLSQCSSILSILKNLSLCLFSASAFPSSRALSYFSFYPHPHSVFIF